MVSLRRNTATLGGSRAYFVVEAILGLRWVRRGAIKPADARLAGVLAALTPEDRRFVDAYDAGKIDPPGSLVEIAERVTGEPYVEPGEAGDEAGSLDAAVADFEVAKRRREVEL